MVAMIYCRKPACQQFSTWFAEDQNKLLVFTIAGVVVGGALGFGLRSANISEATFMAISFPGELLLRMLKCVILPMIIVSLISSLVQMDAHTSGRMGVLTLAYYVLTTTLAVTLATVLVMAIGPGYKVAKNEGDDLKIIHNETGYNDTNRVLVDHETKTADAILDLLRHMVPDNLFRATMQQEETVRTVTTNDYNEAVVVRETMFNDNPNVLGIVVFCIFFGFTAAKLIVDTQIVAQFFMGMEKIIMKMMMTMLWYSPIGIMFLVASNILEVENMQELFEALGLYLVAVLTGLILHFFLVLPLLYLLFTRKNPYRFLYHQIPAWLNVLGPSSSTAALPITAKCLEDGNRVDYRVSRFVLPVGATINIDGAALYEAMAAVFIAQMHNMPLSIGQAVIINLTITLSSVGAASLPGAGLISVLPILAPIPVTAADVGMLITVDWLLDRIRTCNSVLGDSFAAGVVHHYCSKQLAHHEGQEPEKSADTKSPMSDVIKV